MRKTRRFALEALAGMVAGLSGCAIFERIGYEHTYISGRDGKIEAFIDHPGGIKKIEFCDENGNVLYTENLGGNLRGHASKMNVDEIYTGEKITVRVEGTWGSFEKTFENPLLRNDL